MNNSTTTPPPNGYKKTAIGFIPLEWKIMSLGEIATNKNSSLSINKLTDNVGDFPLYGAGKIIKTIDFYEQEEKYISIIKDGAGVGRVLKCLPFSSIVGTMAYIFPKPNNDFDFLFYLLQSISFDKYITGSTIPHVYFKDYSNEKLPIPPLPIQQKIAEILSTWDEAISTTKKAIKKIKKRNKGLAQQLLSGKIRLSGFSEKWNKTELGKISKRVTAKNEELNDTVVTISAQRGFVLQEDFFNKRVASDTLSGYFLLKKGQFAYNKSYSNGYPMGAFKRLNNFDKAVVTTLYICFELLENVNSDYMVHFFENGFMTNNLMKVAKEGGRAHGLLNIGLDDFMSLELTIPSFEEQTAIAQVLETADQELKSYETKLEALQLQKKGLMQQLLTGKIRVNLK